MWIERQSEKIIDADGNEIKPIKTQERWGRQWDIYRFQKNKLYWFIEYGFDEMNYYDITIDVIFNRKNHRVYTEFEHMHDIERMFDWPVENILRTIRSKGGKSE
jgi:hypothetical protein